LPAQAAHRQKSGLRGTSVKSSHWELCLTTSCITIGAVLPIIYAAFGKLPFLSQLLALKVAGNDIKLD
jgi:hypothetical protein